MAKSKALKLSENLNKLFDKFYQVDHEALNGESIHLSKSEYRVLIYIGEHRNCILKEVSDDLLIPKNNMTAIIDKLEKKKIVARVHNSDDRRAINVDLTKKGEAIFSNNADSRIRLSKNLLKSLNRDEQNSLLQILEKLNS